MTCAHCGAPDWHPHYHDCPVLIGGPRTFRAVNHPTRIDRITEINHQNYLDLLAERDPHRAIP